MKAVIYTKYVPPEVLQIKEIQKPTPKDDELLVKVHAATVNRTDCANLRAKPFIMRFIIGLTKPNKLVLGTEFAGVVEAVGKDVKEFKGGDRVFGFDDHALGSHAEYLTISQKKAIASIPENFSYEQAAASVEGAHYAYNFINKVELEPDQHILVNGATGAIGSACLQFLNYYGIQVTAVCQSKDEELIKSLGAKRIIDYTKEDFTKEKTQYDFVFDTVGKSRFKKCLPIIKPGGAYISSELGDNAENVFLSLAKPIIGSKKVLFPVPNDIKRSVLFVKKLAKENKYAPVIDKTFSLDQIVEAYNYVETGMKVGNVVIKMS